MPFHLGMVPYRHVCSFLNIRLICSYDTARGVAPADALAYNFVTDTPGAMLLVPPPDAPSSQPAFHVSVTPNCFAPSSYITTLRRGAGPRGEVVGQFECVPCLAWDLTVHLRLQSQNGRFRPASNGYYRRLASCTAHDPLSRGISPLSTLLVSLLPSRELIVPV
jgi:hypothetical protein